ncbi:MAG: TraX family protein [Bacillota bacterium]|nr:TraX family protein [Bacillota bacterium]
MVKGSSNPFSRQRPIELATLGISGQGLKWIAICTMFIDHIGAMILEPLLRRQGIRFHGSLLLDPAKREAIGALANGVYLDLVLRLIGRLALPIFCFLIVEGFRHTSNVRRYCLRLTTFALISELPFNLALCGRLWAPRHQNVFFTLLLGLLLIVALDRFGLNWRSLVAAALCLGAARYGRTDYGYFGVLFIAVLYLLREYRVWRSLGFVLMAARSITAPLAALPVFFYDGRRDSGKRAAPRWFFYVFYPAHLLLLAFLARLLGAWG